MARNTAMRSGDAQVLRTTPRIRFTKGVQPALDLTSPVADVTTHPDPRRPLPSIPPLIEGCDGHIEKLCQLRNVMSFS
jgi:hypothetical protein